MGSMNKSGFANSVGEILKNRQKRKLLWVPGIPMAILAAIVIITIFAPAIAPHDPMKQDVYKQFLPPVWMDGGSLEHVFGTDYFGRDILSRLILGTRISIFVVCTALLISAVIGTAMGLIAGYAGGILDDIIMRISDALIAIPFMVVAIAFAVAVGSSALSVILIIVAFQWAIYARQIRAETLSLKKQDFVALAKIGGASDRWIIAKHIFPNIIPTVLVLITTHLGGLILWESTLSFLGVGLPPATPSWGTMISEGKNYILTKWWLSAIPGIVIVITVFATNVFGDWIRDRLDPKLRQQ